MKPDWTIHESSADWQCDRESHERFQLRYFRSMSLTEKLRAVENMCRAADYFARKADARRRSSR